MRSSSEISPGDLIDKITILEIRGERIAEPFKRSNVQVELAVCRRCGPSSLAILEQLDKLAVALPRSTETFMAGGRRYPPMRATRRLWPRFIELARSVYQTTIAGRPSNARSTELFGSS